MMSIRRPLATLAGALLLAAGSLPAASSDRQDIERLKLEIEKQKLENERLQLEVEKMKVQATAVPPAPVGKEEKASRKERIVTERAKQSEELARKNAVDETRMVLDFTNGEVWYKGVRHSLNDLPELFDREGWKEKRALVRRNGNGVGKYRLAHLNIASLKYEGRERGVFTWEAPAGTGGLAFDAPEGFSSESPYADIRNKVENEYFTYDRQSKKKKFRILRYKSRKGRMTWDDKLNFWFDADDRLVKVEWGVLDEH
jgi:hypothetical protein